MLHLLKEKTKPVPKMKRRRTVEALAIPAEMASVPVIPPRPRASNIPDKQGGAEESKDPVRSKRNKTPVNSLL